ncbi:MAG: signal recognition particle-docking protein FtsY [Luteitalea sp.]|nr:signal recognition particle-docking protein FtsY [Luteitalea sp.]
MGFLDRLKASLDQTKQQFRDRFDELTGSADAEGVRTRAVEVDTLEALEELLISADVGVAATERIVTAVGERVPRGQSLRDLVKAVILQIFEDASPAVPNDGAPARPARSGWSRATPRVMLLVGVNGTGKTTTVGKLANLFRASGQLPLVCAADTFRAAAVEQLEIWTTRAGVDFIRAQAGADPAALVFDAIKSAQTRGRDPIIVDTAGRLHTRVNLMNELEKIKRVAAREVLGAPHDVLLVLDATVGQNGLVQARQFMSAAAVNGIVLTKLDGTAKGGVAVAIAQDLKLPIRYVGTGESIDDLVPFSAADYVEALFEEKW